MYKGLRFAIKFLIFIFTFPTVDCQVGRNDVKPLLSGPDQKSFEKIEVIFNKAKSAENEANIISSAGKTDKEKARNEKKYLLKRLEASQYYDKANRELSGLLRDKINEFRKVNKNVEIAPSIKNKEEKAIELYQKSKTLRKAADNLIYPQEKLDKSLEAEELESSAVDIFAKVLYACLKHPVAYDVLLPSKIRPDEKSSSPDSLVPANTKPRNNAPEITYIPVIEKDTIITTPAKKDSVVYKSPGLLSNSQEVSTNNKKPVVNQTEKVNVPEYKATEDTSSIYEVVKVKENQVDEFNKFLESSYPHKYEQYIINFRELNYSEIDSLKAAWYRYSQVKFTPEEIASLRKSGVKDSTVLIAESKESKANEKQNNKESLNKSKQDKNIQNQSDYSVPVTGNSGKKTESKGSAVSKPIQTENASDKKGKVKEAVEIADRKTTISAEKTTVPVTNNFAKGFVYRVQIAACRIPLGSESLENIYEGNLTILELHEDNWYKYAIGEFSSYNEARHLKEQVNIPGAFIISYLNGKRIQVLKSASDGTEYLSENGENIHYKVQIAAAKTSLDAEYLKHIYSGSKNIEEIFDEGWHKYLISTGTSLEDTKAFIQNENIPGAFIVSFMGDKKIELKDAIRLNKYR